MSRPHHHILLPNPQHRHRSRSPGRSSTSPTRRYHRQCPITPITSSPLNPNPSPRSNMMMYNPYQWGGGMGGQGAGYPGMQNPYMMGRDPSVMGSMPALSQSSGTEDKNLRPFDSTKMKQGRLGHYGYLEGRGECVWRNKLLTSIKQNSQVLLSAISLLVCSLNTLKPVTVLLQQVLRAQVIKATDHGVTLPVSLVRDMTVVCIFILGVGSIS